MNTDRTPDPDTLQACYFLRELEQTAELLIDQIEKLSQLKGTRRQADRRRRDLYEVRRHINALHRRFAPEMSVLTAGSAHRRPPPPGESIPTAVPDRAQRSLSGGVV